MPACTPRSCCRANHGRKFLSDHAPLVAEIEIQSTSELSSTRASRWIGGNRIELLENGEEFFPRVFEAILQARRA